MQEEGLNRATSGAGRWLVGSWHHHQLKAPSALGAMRVAVWWFGTWLLRGVQQGLRGAQPAGINSCCCVLQPKERDCGEVFRVFHQQQG
ncbi:hypothetical protein A2U01_0053707 [Trifolium medium]|uniref:Uncharacterized protein n=1 Tax=Trifolium medium TaxID=97028 RepID=A0A392R7B7_9FABA|nr:hypothetical protein [Trifolium medium]